MSAEVGITQSERVGAPNSVTVAKYNQRHWFALRHANAFRFSLLLPAVKYVGETHQTVVPRYR
jgi:hypothetical protein